MDFVLKLVNSLQIGQHSKKGKKKKKACLCYFTSNMTQLSLPGTGSTTFNILTVNLSLAITTYCHSHFRQYLYLTQPLQHERSHDLLYLNLLLICFSFFLKGKKIGEYHSAFRCWDTCYILRFWHEQSVEIYFFFHCTGNKSALSENYCSSCSNPFIASSLYTVVNSS